VKIAKIILILCIFYGCASTEETTFPTPEDAGITTLPAPTSTSSTQGSCSANFCPTNGAGKSCCVTSNGPCGIDLGMGCVIQSKD